MNYSKLLLPLIRGVKMLHDAEHYWNLLRRNGRTKVGFAMATNTVYAAKFGVCESENIMDREWLLIAAALKRTYGNNLTSEQALIEMKSCWLPVQ